jgi:hypothetical protein
MPVEKDFRTTAEFRKAMRDYFASKAMPQAWAALLHELGDATHLEGTSVYEVVYEVVSEASYEMADAMLKAREA